MERTQHLYLWYDHSPVLYRGYILVTLSVIFDEAVFDVSLYDEKNMALNSKNIYIYIYIYIYVFFFIYLFIHFFFFISIYAQCIHVVGE